MNFTPESIEGRLAFFIRRLSILDQVSEPLRDIDGEKFISRHEKPLKDFSK